MHIAYTRTEEMLMRERENKIKTREMQCYHASQMAERV